MCRQDQMNMENKVREMREMKKYCLDDLAILTNKYRDLYALKEENEKQYIKVMKICEEVNQIYF